MKSSFPGEENSEPEDQRDGRWLNASWQAGKAITLALLTLYAITILIFLIVLVYKLKKYVALRRFINFYMYIGILGVLSMRIASNIYLVKFDDLNSNFEVLWISSFFLWNTVSLLIWARRIVLFRFEEASEYYARIKIITHIIAVTMIILLAIVQVIGIIFKIWSYVNTSLEVIFISLNLFLTWKMIRYFRVFDFNETKKILKWTYVITIWITFSYICRIVFNILGFIGNDNLLTRGEDLNGKNKMVHFTILTLIEFIPIWIWILYIALTKGEIERTLSISLKSSEMNWNHGYQRLEIGGTITGSNNSSQKARSSLVIEKY